ncbi:hypothetical protein Sgleb_62510 [Streptomyces glebosus]|uniref:Uncharacterized protein n=1 Tax=Streptomyces glebosus TaxID=249580 RepID=A0A640T4S2_9ACTN|nr:hypothetical protein Sgleb_62510 [Streptomyces glebosus]GHG45386.1 hypothetical protein GCM10010513_00510 [Streptomyces glebosus]
MLVPPGVVTVVSTTPAPDGATTDTEVGEVAVMVAGLLPKRTTVAPARPVPVSVAAKPPPVEPWFGLIGIFPLRFRAGEPPGRLSDSSQTGRPPRGEVRPRYSPGWRSSLAGRPQAVVRSVRDRRSHSSPVTGRKTGMKR